MNNLLSPPSRSLAWTQKPRAEESCWFWEYSFLLAQLLKGTTSQTSLSEHLLPEIILGGDPGADFIPGSRRNVKGHPGLPSRHTAPALPAEFISCGSTLSSEAPFIQTANFSWCFPNAFRGFVHHNQPDLSLTARGKGHILSSVHRFCRSQELLSQLVGSGRDTSNVEGFFLTWRGCSWAL